MVGQPWNVSTSGGVPETRSKSQWLQSFIIGCFKSRQKTINVVLFMPVLVGCCGVFPFSHVRKLPTLHPPSSTIFHQQLWCYSWVARVVPPSTDSDRCSSHPPICGPSTPCSWSASPELLAVAAWPAKKLLSSFRTSKSQEVLPAYFLKCGHVGTLSSS